MEERKTNSLDTARQKIVPQVDEKAEYNYSMLKFFANILRPAVEEAGTQYVERELPPYLLQVLDDFKKEIEGKHHLDIRKEIKVSPGVSYDDLPLEMQKEIVEKNRVNLVPRKNELSYISNGVLLFSATINTTGIDLKDYKNPTFRTGVLESVQIVVQGDNKTKVHLFDESEIQQLAKEIVEIIDKPTFGFITHYTEHEESPRDYMGGSSGTN